MSCFLWTAKLLDMFTQTSAKSDIAWLSHQDLTIFNTAVVRNLEFDQKWLPTSGPEFSHNIVYYLYPQQSYAMEMKFKTVVLIMMYEGP